jgi:hypothetical protein
MGFGFGGIGDFQDDNHSYEIRSCYDTYGSWIEIRDWDDELGTEFGPVAQIELPTTVAREIAQCILDSTKPLLRTVDVMQEALF